MTTKESTNVSQLIRDLDTTTRDYTNARNALVGHVILTGVKQSVIVAETGLDKGTVSRIAKLAKGLTGRPAKALAGLDVSAMVANDVTTLSTAIALGAKLVRVHPAKPNTTTADKVDTSTVTVTADENADMLPSLHAWLVASNDKQFAARAKAIADMLAAIKAERAEAVAA